MAGYRDWLGVVGSFLLFGVVFFCQQSDIADHHQGKTGLLLFLIPGVIGSYLSISKRLLAPLRGALYALPLCLLMRYFWLAPPYSFWQELAYGISAVFWCAFGAMLFLMVRTLLQPCLPSRRH
ncbi:inner membrane protein YbjM [Serratia sp. AKBS12]|uniref:inner membrane protein YbjM n=1 Tax=Serratia sp. AKBS12 TaxID=2974597 RepID=UPI00216507FE|nr:inner membrane protein YbjM [Serratia sp. AKBS12]MCS3409306.1 inner membrane protein YbjM [Serratia sp. AKBS12]HEI8865631.1 inner membrane protein YbjM [Serratia odorifera]